MSRPKIEHKYINSDDVVIDVRAISQHYVVFRCKDGAAHVVTRSYFTDNFKEVEEHDNQIEESRPRHPACTDDWWPPGKTLPTN